MLPDIAGASEATDGAGASVGPTDGGATESVGCGWVGGPVVVVVVGPVAVVVSVVSVVDAGVVVPVVPGGPAVPGVPVPAPVGVVVPGPVDVPVGPVGLPPPCVAAATSVSTVETQRGGCFWLGVTGPTQARRWSVPSAALAGTRSATTRS